jgi:hypothetical protein
MNTLFNEIEFYEKTGLNKSIRERIKNDSKKLKDIEIITPKVLERIEKNFSFFLKFGSNPF